MSSADSSTTSGPATCPVLLGQINFAIWNLCIRNLLRSKDVLGIVDGSDPKASGTPHVSPVIYYSEYETITSHTAWLRRDEEARALICDRVSDAIMLQVGEMESAKAIYDAITQMFNATNAGTIAFYTFVELFESSWDGTSPIDDHITKIRSASNRLIALKKPIDNEYLAFFLLLSLPSNQFWENFKSSVISSQNPDSPLTFETVVSRLSAQCLHLPPASSNPASGAPASSESALKVKSDGDKKQLYCKKHGKCAHTTEDCRQLKDEKKWKKKRKGKGKGKEKANHADEKSSSSSEGSVTQTTTRHM